MGARARNLLLGVAAVVVVVVAWLWSRSTPTKACREKPYTNMALNFPVTPLPRLADGSYEVERTVDAVTQRCRYPELRGPAPSDLPPCSMEAVGSPVPELEPEHPTSDSMFLLTIEERPKQHVSIRILLDGKVLFIGAEDSNFDPCGPYIRMLPAN